MHKRKNLHVLTNAQVTRVLFDEKENKEGPQVSGVVFRRGGKTGGGDEVVKCNKEVILCGGAVNSPQLLLLSGIGPREELRKFDIEVLVDAPNVGKNLQDHMLFAVPYESKTPTYSVKDGNIFNVLKYYIKKKGPLTTTGLECTAFFNTGVQPELKAPDAQIHFLAATLGQAESNNTNADPKKVNNPKVPYSFSMICVLLHPKSIGSVTLKSADPFEYPVIEPNYLKDEDDVKTIVLMTRKAEQIANSKAFAPHMKAPLSWEGLKEVPAHLKPDSDELLAYRARMSALTCYHPTGTCKMGKDVKDGAVVDPQLRVFGVRGLRVADCSIMPTLISGNTNAPAIMIGERVADFIKKARAS